MLYRQQVCSLPRIGTFTLQPIPARYNVVDKTIYPPGRMIIFDEQWTDDGSCQAWLSLKENLVPTVAMRKLEKYIEELKAALQTGEPLKLPGIGHLQADPMGHINFSQETLPGSLDILQLAPVIRPDASPRITVGTTEMIGQQVVEHLTAMPERPNNAFTSRFKWWWAAAPAAAVLAGLLIWFVSSGSEPSENKNNLAAQPAAVDTMTLHEAVTQTDSNNITPAATTADTLQYYVVFASYTDRAKAERQYRKLKGWGHNVAMYSTKDSSTFKLAIPFHSLAADTAANVDKIRKNYGGKVYLEF